MMIPVIFSFLLKQPGVFTFIKFTDKKWHLQRHSYFLSGDVRVLTGSMILDPCKQFGTNFVSPVQHEISLIDSLLGTSFNLPLSSDFYLSIQK